MEWIKIDKDNLPSGSVLAANFTKGSDCYKNKLYGDLNIDEDDNSIYCFCDNLRGGCNTCEYKLTGVTHYIDIDKIDIENKLPLWKEYIIALCNIFK